MRATRLLFALPLLLAACSGASSGDIPADGADAAPVAVPAPTASPAPVGDPHADAGDPTLPGMPGTISGTGADASVGADAGAAPKGDGGPMADSGTAPPGDGGGIKPGVCSGTRETEPNDTLATANPFTSSICGELKGTDVDYASFALRADATRIDATYTSTGPVAFHVTVKGQTFEILGPASLPIPFFPGETYVFEVSTPGKKPEAYELRVVVQ